MIAAGELLVVAVEASADLHGAAVLRELKALAPQLHAFGSAGPLMRAEGCEALVRAESLGVMGLVEVLPAIPRILRALKTLRLAARERRPRAALLIDSPDFNLRLAKKLRGQGVPVAYFIGPSVWAWRTYRVKQIARDIARMLVILPFEAAFYAKHGVRAEYVGNPLADRLALPQNQNPSAEVVARKADIGTPRDGPGASEAARPDGPQIRSSTSTSDAAVLAEDSRARPDRKRALGLDPARPLLALLPGSRRQEIARLWQPMVQAARLLRARDPSLQFAAPVAPGIDELELREAALDLWPHLKFLRGSARELLEAADAAVVTSGTATLEAALALCPSVVVYRMNEWSYRIARRLVRVKFIALPNLLADRALLPELIQGACTPEAIARAAAPLLAGSDSREEMRRALLGVRDQVAPPDAPNVARRVAEAVLDLWQSPPR